MRCSFCATREGARLLRLPGSQQVWHLCSDAACVEKSKKQLALTRQMMNARCYACGVVIRKTPHKEDCVALAELGRET